MIPGPEESEIRIVLEVGGSPLPGYRLVGRLGEGGFGEVWMAEGPGGFKVALKCVRLDKGAGIEGRSLELLKHVRHPNLLTPFGSWQLAEFLIIAMELADSSLWDRLQEAKKQGELGISGDELLEYMAETAKGIDYLNTHRHDLGDGKLVGIQHRDLKPQNILLSGGGVKVADFGLSRLLENSVTAHAGGLTPHYAPPEFFGDKIHNRSDQYSLGVTYCVLRGGVLPFRGNPAQLIAGHLYGEPDLTALPEPERPIVRRAMAKSPEARWPHCRAFIDALRVAGAASGAVHHSRARPDFAAGTPLFTPDGSSEQGPTITANPVVSAHLLTASTEDVSALTIGKTSPQSDEPSQKLELDHSLEFPVTSRSLSSARAGGTISNRGWPRGMWFSAAVHDATSAIRSIVRAAGRLFPPAESNRASTENLAIGDNNHVCVKIDRRVHVGMARVEIEGLTPLVDINPTGFVESNSEVFSAFIDVPLDVAPAIREVTLVTQSDLAMTRKKLRFAFKETAVTHYRRGLQALAHDRAEEASRHFGLMKSLDDPLFGPSKRGDAYQNAGHHDKAVDEYTAAIRESAFPGDYRRRAKSYAALCRYAEAEADLQKAGNPGSEA